MTAAKKSDYVKDLCSTTAIVPVLVIEEVSAARPVAQSLLDNGFSILEVTLRTSAALEVIHEMSKIPGVVVAAGTITSARHLKLAKQAGALFGVTPGTTPSILAAADAESLPLLPGVATVSEIMLAVEHGYDFLKFFPAESAGGKASLKSFAGPFPDLKFCPTGGITIENTPDYLALKNVICVGGSWVAPAEMVRSKRWEEISRLAREAQQSLNN